MDYNFIERATPFGESYSTLRLLNSYDEDNDGERLTIDAGYVDPQKQIQQFMLAGEQLNSYREFDEEEALNNEEFASAVARIRHPNTDITDITTYTEYINDRMQKAKSEAERKAIKQELDVKNTYKSYEKEAEDTTEPPEESEST